MTQFRYAVPLLLAVALPACQQRSDDSNIAIDNAVDAAEVADADVETLPPSESSASLSAPATQRAGAALIPASYRGRWGIVPADCTSTRGDAKGLIDISDGGIRFFEAQATLKEQRPAVATAFSGLFAFSGEGQSWERVETLSVEGDTLRRSSTTPRGDEGEALTYQRCKA